MYVGTCSNFYVSGSYLNQELLPPQVGKFPFACCFFTHALKRSSTWTSGKVTWKPRYSRTALYSIFRTYNVLIQTVPYPHPPPSSPAASRGKRTLYRVHKNICAAKQFQHIYFWITILSGRAAWTLLPTNVIIISTSVRSFNPSLMGESKYRNNSRWNKRLDKPFRAAVK